MSEQKKEETRGRHTFFLATSYEWLGGLAVFLLLSLTGRPQDLMPLMLFAWIAVTYSLVVFRVKFREKISFREAYKKEKNYQRKFPDQVIQESKAKNSIRRKIDIYIVVSLICIYFIGMIVYYL